ncbi:hypothetical protein Dimus_021930 [Dionaea muscipula]
MEIATLRCSSLRWPSSCRIGETIYSELVDEKLGSDVNFEEVERLVKVAVLCTNGSPSTRPAMSDVEANWASQMEFCPMP